MSSLGTGSLSLRKKDVANQKSGAIGFRDLAFAHQAASGDTGFNLNNLTAPPDMVAAGFIQPSLEQISSAKMLFNRNNLKVISSEKGILVDFLSYFVTTNNQIVFNGWTASDGEIFTCVISSAPISGAKMVDATPLNATGTLVAGQTDFVVGTPYEVGKYINYQVGAVLVFADGVLQYRNVGNVTAAPAADGNYEEVNPGGGLGVIIRFNNAFPGDVPVTVISNGLLVHQPIDSQMAVLEKLSGTVDKLVEATAVIAGVPETDFQANPSNVDLKAFGDRVLDLEGVLVDGDIGALTWNGTAPSGTITKRYKWIRQGRVVTLEWRIEASVAGVTNSTVAWNLPSDMPLPSAHSNQGDSEWVTTGSGNILASAGGNLSPANGTGLYRINSTTFQVNNYIAATVSATYVIGCLTYITD